MSELILIPAGCTVCGDARADGLYARIGQDTLCARCWHARRCPAPLPAPMTFEAEQRVRERMVERGGAARYQVLAGKA